MLDLIDLTTFVIQQINLSLYVRIVFERVGYTKHCGKKAAKPGGICIQKTSFWHQ